MATLKQKKKLIDTIRNPIRYFRLTFGRYGGEVAMGKISEEQYDYWSQKDQSEFEEYMVSVESDPDDANKDIPGNAQFDQPFYEYNDFCQLSGPEFANGQTLYIEELNKDGEPLDNGEGGYVEDIQHDFDDFTSLGVEIDNSEVYNAGSKACKDHYYVFGQYFNKGSWHTPDIIKTGPDGILMDKMKLYLTDADGFKAFSDVEYDGESYSLEEDSTGKSSSFYVMEGDDV